jgi:hypothetical protein
MGRVYILSVIDVYRIIYLSSIISPGPHRDARPAGGRLRVVFRFSWF